MSYPSAPGHGQPHGRPRGYPGQGAAGFPGRSPNPGGGVPPGAGPTPGRAVGGPSGPPRGAGRGRPGGRAGGSVRLDPVIVETVVGLIWLAVGTVGLGADGIGTVLLALGLAGAAYVLVQNRRYGPGVFDAVRSAELLRLGGAAVAVIVVASIVLGLVGFADFLPGLAAVVTGAAFVLLARSTGQRPTHWLGVGAVVLGLISAFASTQEANPQGTGGLVSQGLLGVILGVALIASAADRVGLLEMLRDRSR